MDWTGGSFPALFEAALVPAAAIGHHLTGPLAAAWLALDTQLGVRPGDRTHVPERGHQALACTDYGVSGGADQADHVNAGWAPETRHVGTGLRRPRSRRVLTLMSREQCPIWGPTALHGSNCREYRWG